MAYEQNPLKYSRTSNMPGLEYSEEDLAQKKRVASNALGITPPADLLDGEFFLKDNDPQDFYRTLYIKRSDSLDKVVTFTNTGKAIFDGVNEINLSDDEEVKGVLPKKKIITAAATVQVNNISTIVTYDGNKFQEVRKDDFVNKVVDDVNAGIDLANYYTKIETDNKFFNKKTDILGVNKGGTGTNDGFGWKNAYSDVEFNAKIGLSYPFTTQELVTTIINTFLNTNIFCMVSGWRKGQSFITDFPSSDLSHRTIINYQDRNQFYIETIDPYTLTTYICNVSRDIAGPWIKTRNADGSIPAELISPTVLKYENSDGVWTETKLTTGEVMLKGRGAGYNDTSDYVVITLPKTCVSIGNINSSISIYGVVSGSCGFAGMAGQTTEAFKGFCITNSSFTISAGADKKLMGYTWQFQGILA